MARIPVNQWTNVLTEEHTTNPRIRFEITIPRFRARISPREAAELRDALDEAVKLAKKLEDGPDIADGKKKCLWCSNRVPLAQVGGNCAECQAKYEESQDGR